MWNLNLPHPAPRVPPGCNVYAAVGGCAEGCAKALGGGTAEGYNTPTHTLKPGATWRSGGGDDGTRKGIQRERLLPAPPHSNTHTHSSTQFHTHTHTVQREHPPPRTMPSCVMARDPIFFSFIFSVALATLALTSMVWHSFPIITEMGVSLSPSAAGDAEKHRAWGATECPAGIRRASMVETAMQAKRVAGEGGTKVPQIVGTGAPVRDALDLNALR